MKISIAIATYNGARYLPEQLDSFLRQKKPPHEVVICDDDSSDSTMAILQSFQKDAPFEVRIEQNPIRLGYKKNFEKAISLCTGDIIFLSDQDDYWFDTKILEMTRVLLARPNIFVIHTDMIITDENLVPSRQTQLGNILALGSTVETYVSGCATALRREWVSIVLPIPTEVAAHDTWIHKLALAMDVRTICLPPQQYYRRHDKNVSQWRASKPEQMNVLDSIRVYGLADKTGAWRRELDRTRWARKRLLERTENLEELGLLSRQETAIRKLDRRISALESRIHNNSQNRLKRLPKIIRLWLSGDYNNFSGWKSALKDILRQQSNYS
ncbi:Glycosyltransferase involved in cell wall bisynthesis [Azotobacter beijerinckii]|uniref:Glycosyltransferase involved in cell wall bisynthesis n=1 Tax=Azotobacter beijerinckii TaxID=170623 RepID=A0A1H6UCX8_9GAMM|nr:glycosyltransferase [Azotobacter beijerinckii]SEI87507.1 Glycosyltransferase involved in cell wall bisynthesis [Azotobacter beijerinckii]